jgi:hypothetical protein
MHNGDHLIFEWPPGDTFNSVDLGQALRTGYRHGTASQQPSDATPTSVGAPYAAVIR